LQDTFIRIFENAKTYQPIGKPMSWIFTVELNIINRFYQLKARKHLIDDDNLLDSIRDNELSYSESLSNNDYLNNLLRHLDDDEIEVISLHIVSNLKFREISQLLNKPLSTILSKYNRAIKKVKKIAKEEN
jgi:RNA polymerase sigma-70 factor (ECF subfamily)